MRHIRYVRMISVEWNYSFIYIGSAYGESMMYSALLFLISQYHILNCNSNRNKFVDSLEIQLERLYFLLTAA
jgi:hypothetical protein